MEIAMAVRDDVALIPRVLAHYHLVADRIEASLGRTPIVYKNYPGGIDTAGHFEETTISLSADKLLWLVHAKYAIEFYTWAPLPSDDDRLRFARILLESPPGVSYGQLRAAAKIIHDLLLHEAELEAIPLLDGGTGIALWVPLANAPHAASVRTWLHGVANRAAAERPDVVSIAPNTHHDGRVHIHVSSNAAGHYSTVPYSLRAQGLRVCTPVYWNELDGFDGADAFTVDSVAARMRKHGDVFAKEYARLTTQRFIVTSTTLEVMSPPRPLLDAAIAVLADGKPRTVDEILAEARKRGLFSGEQTRKHLYTALSQYVQRTLGRGRRPSIVEESDRRFRLNHTVDDWPAIDTTGLPPLATPGEPPDTARECVAALRASASGSDPTAFEKAVCAAFELFGFASTHVGGNGAPDGYADALLGPLGYRVTIECKLGRDDTIAQSDAVAEAAKYRNSYGAEFAVLVAPSFDAEATFVSELRLHRIAAWTVDDLVQAATLRLDAFRMKTLFEPGYAADGLDDFVWALVHGPAKRLRTIASLLMEGGLAQQRMAHTLGDTAAALKLSVDVGMAMVDMKLACGGSSHGVTREEVDAAFAWLTSPYVGKAVWSDEARQSIVILPAIA